MSYFDPMFMFLFLPVVLLVYQIAGRKLRKVVLLLANTAFFVVTSKQLIIWLAAVIVVMYIAGLLLAKTDEAYANGRSAQKSNKERKKEKTRYKRLILTAGIGIPMGILIVLKYSGFILTNINALTGASFNVPAFLLPIGISFYTLQAVSYQVDVYRGTIKADRNLLRVALYMSFFPQIMEGPIARYAQTAEALYAGEPIKEKNLAFGTQRFIWGMFKKFVIADRLAPAVTAVFDGYAGYSGSVILFGAVVYTLQLYMDFSGCIDMTIGIGEMFGVTIPENFRQPFFSRSASEFWRRWHITLGAWLKEYIFYSVSLAKPVKKIGKATKEKIGKHLSGWIPMTIALFCVWIFNGFWHGSDWQYLIYGMYYFVLISLGNLLEPVFVKLLTGLHLNREKNGYKVWQLIRTLVIIITGEMFFNANSLSDGFAMFGRIFTDFNPADIGSGVILGLGLKWQEWLIVALSLVVALIVDIMHEKGMHLRERIAAFKLPARWTVYYAAIFAVIIFGAYGAGHTVIDIIYAGF